VIKKEKKVKEEKEDIQEKAKNDIRLKSQMNQFMDKYFNKLMGGQHEV
jgi:hypothetical protein